LNPVPLTCLQRSCRSRECSGRPRGGVHPVDECNAGARPQTHFP
jgi:hypothetical protein